MHKTLAPKTALFDFNFILVDIVRCHQGFIRRSGTVRKQQHKKKIKQKKKYAKHRKHLSTYLHIK